jgi:predicted MFS family arabinose efflux permease
MLAAPGLKRIASAFRNRNYAIYTTGSGVSLIGTWMQRIAVGWLMWQLTESGTWLGLVAFANLFPTIVVGPFAGVIADRWDRLRVIKTSQSLALIQALTLFALTAAGVMTAPILLILTFWLGAVAALNQPSRLALIPSLVREEDVSTAVAINSVIFNCARFLGPAVAGLIIVAGGVALAFAVNALSFVAFLFALSRLHLVQADDAPVRGEGILEDLREGFRYAVGHAGVAALLAILTVTSICARPVVELLPGFAAAVFAGGPETLALLTSTVGIGAVIAGLWMAQRQTSQGLTVIVLSGATAIALALFAFVASDRLSVALPALAIAGVFMVANGIGTQTLLILRVAPAMRGRVLSLYGLIFRGGPAIGALALGALSESTGLRIALALGAAITLLTALLALTRFPHLRDRLEIGASPPT